MFNQFYLGRTLTEIYLAPPQDHARNQRSHLVQETLRTQLHLFRFIRELRPFNNEARYIHYLRLRYAFRRRAQPAYLLHPVRASFLDLDQRSRLAALSRDLSVMTGSHDFGSKQFLVAKPQFDMPTALGWILAAEAISSFSPIFLHEVAAIGLDEHFGATHLNGSVGHAQAQWRRLCISIELTLRDGLDIHDLLLAISTVLQELRTLADEAIQ